MPYQDLTGCPFPRDTGCRGHPTRFDFETLATDEKSIKDTELGTQVIRDSKVYR
jgi:hypothetical protein